MKKQAKSGRYLFRTIKLDLKMKLSLLVLLVTTFALQANTSYSQNAKVSLDVKDATIAEVLDAIESQSDFTFIFNTNAVALDRKVTLKFDKKKISNVLDELFSNENTNFEIHKKKILLRKSDKNGNGNTKANDAKVKVAQSEVTGTIKDELGGPLPGASIVEKGTTNGVTTDFDGNFTIELSSSDAVLTISYIGYKTEEIIVGNQTQIELQLTPDSALLEEVVVIGYGTVKKSDVTGSVGSVKSEEITKTPTMRLDDALVGKAAGLQITPTSSAPGAATTVRIRGSNSLSANSEPLYVIDGFVGAGNLNDINTSDIESVEILKDASATAIYGSRGSNGVIIVTTKRGKVGDTKISYETYVNVASPTRYLDMMNAAEFGSWQNEVQGSIVYPDTESLGEGIDWQKEIYKSNALMVNHNLSVSGGTEKNRFYISGNYLDQDGIHIESNFKRYLFRINTEHKVGDILKIGTNISMSRTVNNARNTSAENLLGWFPNIPVRDSDGEFTFQTVSSELAADNPVSVAVQTDDIRYSFRALGNVYAELDIAKGLKYKLNLGVNYDNGRQDSYIPSTLFSQQAEQGTATIINNEKMDLLIENTLNYNTTFGEDHSFSALFGYTRQSITNTQNLVQTQGFVTDSYLYDNLAAGVVRSNATSNKIEEGLVSYLFRANYSYKSKYLVTASARVDGSSVFSKNNKWGTFPSLALAWRASREDFIRDWGIFDDLKFRFSYGALGNPGVEPGASLTRLSQINNNYILGIGQGLVAGIAANALGNDNLKWETSKQFNYGMDMAFFKNRLTVSLDYYNKTTTDLLVAVPILYTSGFETTLSNFGSISNKGFEVSLSSVNIDTENFKWTTSFNISRNRNKVVDLADESGILFINEIGRGNTSISGVLQEGQPIGTFYGLEADGIWNTQAEIDASGLSGFSVFPGARRYVDLDGDNVINAILDRKIIGDSNPNFIGGLGNNLTYKNFDFSFYFSFVQGNEIFNETGSRIGVAFDNNTFSEFADRWTPTNTDSNIPSAAGVERPLITSNSAYIEDGSFVRLRNISLSYNIPVDGIDWLDRARVYVSGTNLLLFDNYSGYDPEVNRNPPAQDPGSGNVRRGYDLAQDPSTRSYTIGVKLDF